jgi:hypothetical protein
MGRSKRREKMGIPKQALEQAQQAEEAMKRAQAVERPPQEATQDLSQEKPQGTPQAEAAQEPAPSVVGDANLQAMLNREIQLRKTLEGRLKSQLKPANEEVRRLRKELADVVEKMEQMNTQKEDVKPGVERYLTDEEKTELGDVLDVNARMVKGILEEEFGTGKIEKVVELLMAKSAEQATEESKGGPSSDFWPMVDGYCPGARDLNRANDPRWLQFLEQHNTSTGQLNREIAEEAFENDDPITLADLFTDCMRQNGISGNDLEAPELTTKPENGAREEQSPVAAMSPPGKWTRAEVTAFYTDVAKGVFKGTKADQARLEAEIMAAAHAGTITG